MTFYYYMYRSWQDCCRRGENRSSPSVSVESVDSEYWCLNNAIVYAFIIRLTVEECAYGLLLNWTFCSSSCLPQCGTGSHCHHVWHGCQQCQGIVSEKLHFFRFQGQEDAIIFGPRHLLKCTCNLVLKHDVANVECDYCEWRGTYWYY